MEEDNDEDNIIEVGEYYEEDYEEEEEFEEEEGMKFDKIPSRCGHVSHCVGMNLLVWGGYQDDPAERYLPPIDLWVYNIELEFWTCYKTSGDVPPGMSGCCSCLYDGHLYIISGHCHEGNISTVYKLNLKNLTWTKVIVLGYVMSPRDKASSWCYNHKIYVFGGFGVPTKGYLNDHGNFEFDPTLQAWPSRNRGWNNQIVIFDINDETWSNPKCKGVVPQPRAAHATARIGDTVYLFGGRYLCDRLNDLHSLNLTTLTWSGELNVSSNVPCGRSWHILNTISDKLLFLYGGFTQQQVPLSDAWVLDVVSLQWTQLNVPINRPRLWHSACTSQQNDLIIFGGCANDILDQRVPTVHTNDIIYFRVTPKSLQRLCFDAVYDDRERTESSWEFLPHNIKSMLYNKLRAYELRTNKKGRTIPSKLNLQKSCCIS